MRRASSTGCSLKLDLRRPISIFDAIAAASRKQVSDLTPPKRQAPRCRKCPGKPLRSECDHGRKKAGPGPRSNDAGSGLQAGILGPLMPPAVNSAPNPPSHAFATTAGTVGAFQVPAFPFNPMLHPPFTPGAFPNATFPLPPSTLPIDPSLLAQSHGQLAPVVIPPQLATTPPLATDEGLKDSNAAPDSSEDSDTAGESSEDSEKSEAEEFKKPSPSTKKKRVYASDKNPHHGYIEGVGRGNRLIKMARQRKLKTVYTEQHASSVNWRRLTRDLMTRAEDVANRTASWLYIAIHNPAASQPFTHFASRRLRLEAPEDLQKIHQQVSSLMTVLKRADRSHSFQSEKEKEQVLQKMQEATEKAEKAMEQVAKAESEAQRLRDELEARNKVLSELFKSAQAAQS
ncbi:hypothetical protein H1R20_g1110, partial [Candolleomyces eurysporus]